MFSFVRLRAVLALSALSAVLAACSSSPTATSAPTRSAPSGGETSARPSDAELANRAGANLPLFQLPAPRPSAVAVLPRALLLQNGPKLSDVSDKMRALLDRAGYGDASFFRVPDGFAIATRMERIHPDGSPYAGDQRWATDPGGLLAFGPGVTLASLCSALLHADPGHYRVFVFVATDQPVTSTSTGMMSDKARTLVVEGAAALPQGFDQPNFNAAYGVTALVYEFDRSAAGKEATLSIPSVIPGRTQLQRAGVLP